MFIFYLWPLKYRIVLALPKTYLLIMISLQHLQIQILIGLLFISINQCTLLQIVVLPAVAKQLFEIYIIQFLTNMGLIIVIEGHTHDYQRSFPIKFNPNSQSNPIITNNRNNYNDPEGRRYAIVGTGGVNFHSSEWQSSFIASQQSIKIWPFKYWCSKQWSYSHREIYSQCRWNKTDQFTITKSNNNIISTTSTTNRYRIGYPYEPFFNCK